MFRRTSLIAPSLYRCARFNSTQSYLNAVKTLKTDLKAAMMAKDDFKKETIRGLLAAIKNYEIDAKDKQLNEFSLYDVYSKLIKQRKDSIREFELNDRKELVTKEKDELAILQKYIAELPVSTAEQIEVKVIEYLNKLKETEPTAQMRNVMKNFDWEKLPAEWKASPSVIRSTISNQFKKLFKSN